MGAENGTYENGAYENRAYENGAYENRAYENGAYENGAYENGAYENGAYENRAYENRASTSFFVRPLRGLPSVESTFSMRARFLALSSRIFSSTVPLVINR